MKKLVVMASLVAVSTSMMAMDLQYFLGAGAERGSLDWKGSVDIPSLTYSENISGDMSDTGLKLKAGVILDKTHRISLSHAKFSGSDVDFTLILGNYDYLIPVNEDFRFLAGIHAGNAKYEETDVDLGKFDMSGLAYGVQIGGIYDITKNVELEVGFAYTKYNVDESFSGTISGIDFNANAELEDSTSMSAGINYKF